MHRVTMACCDLMESMLRNSFESGKPAVWFNSSSILAFAPVFVWNHSRCDVNTRNWTTANTLALVLNKWWEVHAEAG